VAACTAPSVFQLITCIRGCSLAGIFISKVCVSLRKRKRPASKAPKKMDPAVSGPACQIVTVTGWRIWAPALSQSGATRTESIRAVAATELDGAVSRDGPGSECDVAGKSANQQKPIISPSLRCVMWKNESLAHEELLQPWPRRCAPFLVKGLTFFGASSIPVQSNLPCRPQQNLASNGQVRSSKGAPDGPVLRLICWRHF